MGYFCKSISVSSPKMFESDDKETVQKSKSGKKGKGTKSAKKKSSIPLKAGGRSFDRI